MKMKKVKMQIPDIDKLPLFWRNLIMMLCFLLLLILAQLLSFWALTRTLTQRDLEKAKSTLTADCEQLSEALFAIEEIPQILEDSRPYSDVAAEKAETLPHKYYYTMNELSKIVSRHTYLLGDYYEWCYMLPRVNTVYSKSRSVNDADTYFKELIMFSESSNEEVFELMKKEGSFQILPIQDIQVQRDQKPVHGFGVVVHPLDCNTGVFVIYEEEILLKKLGLGEFPEGTRIIIENKAGTIIEDYTVGKADHGECFEISGEMAKQRLVVKVSIPKNHFSLLLIEPKKIATIITLIFGLIALVLCFCFSQVSAKPIINILEQHGKALSKQSGNEIKLLENLLKDSEDKALVLRSFLIQSQMTRLFSGTILQDEERNKLSEDLRIEPPFRVAIVIAPQKAQWQILQEISSIIENNGIYQVINNTETGVLFSNHGTNLEMFVENMNAFSVMNEEIMIRCGISGSIEKLEDFGKGLQQARLTVPEKPGVNVFSLVAKGVERKMLTWTQHELFYQSLLSENRESAFQLMKRAAEETSDYYGNMVYYDLLFSILSVASEAGIHEKELQVFDYDRKLSSSENILRLSDPVTHLFDQMDEKRRTLGSKKHEEILSYIKQHYTDPNLGLIQVASTFGMREGTFYEQFEKITGMRFAEYLLYIRMNRIEELLRTTDMSISEIGNACGYPSKSTFFRLFKQYYGMTPSAYRQRIKKREPEN